MTQHHRRSARKSWHPAISEEIIEQVCRSLPTDADGVVDAIEVLVDMNAEIHEEQCVNLNPATNTMLPRAAAVLGRGLSSRTSLGFPGAKYEMGLEAIERIEIVAAELASNVFNADYAEVRVPSGAMANMFAFMATAKPGDTIIAPPATIAGHVTHHSPGVAGLYGLQIHEAPIAAERYTIDIEQLAVLAATLRPRVITIGSSLNLTHHDVAAIRTVADEHDAYVLFDAAHLSGPIAGGSWPNPLDHGAHLMTMSTYKSLGGPVAGLVLTNDSSLAERIDEIAFPGLTANFDAGKTAALAITLADWLDDGDHKARAMIENAQLLANELQAREVDVFECDGVATLSHAFALDARSTGGGMTTARWLRRANLLSSAIGLPTGLDDGVRLGMNEATRLGAAPDDIPELASLIEAAIRSDRPEDIAPQVSSFRSRTLAATL